MTGRIWKFRLRAAAREQVLALPPGARVLHLAVQGEAPVLYMACDPNLTASDRRIIRSCLTGDEAPVGKYIGTAMLEGGSFVVHYFDGGL